MKSRFFYGMFVGFFLGCLFFFGVMKANAQTRNNDYKNNYSNVSYNAALNPNAYTNLYDEGNMYYNWNTNGRADYNNIG